jgi:hypothetical protein
MRIAAVLAALVAAAVTVHADEPTIDMVLLRAAAYVASYQQQLRGLVAEETYIQNSTTNVFAGNLRGSRLRPNREGRRLRSDLLLVKLGDDDWWLQFRDVFEVDREPVRDRDSRLYKLFVDGKANARAMAEAIQAESARYNIGPVVRTINIPIMGLLFLERGVQPGMSFKRVEAGNVKRLAELAPAERIWTIEFNEVRKGTMVKGENNRDLPSHGRIWIDSETGRILRTSVITEDTELRAEIDVTYKAESGLNLLVPAEMKETYAVRRSEARIDGRATYGKYRQFTVTTSEKTDKPKP